MCVCVCVYGTSAHPSLIRYTHHTTTHNHHNTKRPQQVRRHTIVLNLDELRCLLLYDRLIVIVPEGADPDWCVERCSLPTCGLPMVVCISISMHNGERRGRSWIVRSIDLPVYYLLPPHSAKP